MTLTSASSLFLNNAAKRQLELFIITEYWLSLIPAEFKAASEQMYWMHHKNPERMMEAILPFTWFVLESQSFY